MRVFISHTTRSFIVYFLISVALVGCSSLIADYSEQAYRNATSLKAKSVALIRKSTESYSSHRDDVDALLVEVDAAFEYANGIPSNKIVAAQWNILRDPDGNLLGGWAVRWRQQGRLSKFLSEEIASLVADGFDTIICLEINKRSSKTCGDI